MLCGDYSTGKTSLLRRLLCETDGRVADPELVVAGNPTTATTIERRLGALTIVDTPGLESGNEAHRQLTLDALVDAALVCFLHEPAFGSTRSLSDGAFGHSQSLDGAPVRARRSIHVLARLDELTISPERAP